MAQEREHGRDSTQGGSATQYRFHAACGLLPFVKG